MSKEELHNDMLYHAAISMAKSMLEKGLITEEEYAEIDTILLEKYRPYLGTLLSENAGYSSFLELYIDTTGRRNFIENSRENRAKTAGS
mgnify:FL=1